MDLFNHLYHFYFSGDWETLELAEMREGFDYDLRLKNLAPGGGVFHPAEAYYTLRRLP